ncbi:MAG: hypothetical protein HY537_17570 [Deltaproteobacteria bacterium]|nr:hypothetical protein [Deltaproteobacteria bacterium]
MRYHILLLSSTLLASTLFGRWVDKRPELDPRGSDKQLLALLQERTESETMRQVREKYLKTVLDFEKQTEMFKAGTVSAKELDSNESELLDVRYNYISTVGKYGSCVSKPIELQEYTGTTPTERWCVAEGACLIKSHSFFENAKSWFLKLRLEKEAGGFAHILVSRYLDGKKLRDKGWTPSEPLKEFSLFMAVKTYDLFGFMPAFTYYINNVIDDSQPGKFALTFNSVEKPATYQAFAEEIEDKTVAGTVSRYNQELLNPVWGRWQLIQQSDGKTYVEYETAANFGKYFLDIPMAKEGAKAILLSTLIELIEKNAPEAIP